MLHSLGANYWHGASVPFCVRFPLLCNKLLGLQWLESTQICYISFCGSEFRVQIRLGPLFRVSFEAKTKILARLCSHPELRVLLQPHIGCLPTPGFYGIRKEFPIFLLDVSQASLWVSRGCPLVLIMWPSQTMATSSKAAGEFLSSLLW